MARPSAPKDSCAFHMRRLWIGWRKGLREYEEWRSEPSFGVRRQREVAMATLFQDRRVRTASGSDRSFGCRIGEFGCRIGRLIIRSESAISNRQSIEPVATARGSDTP